MPVLEMPGQSEWLRVGAGGIADVEQRSEPAVDRKNNVIRGYVVAEEGPMKDGRGHFTKRSIERLVYLASSMEQGVKVRLSHPNMSDDGVSKYLGRGKSMRTAELPDGRLAAIADMHFDESATKSPHGNLADYVMTRAESDKDSFGTSIVSKFEWFHDGKKIDRGEMYRLRDEKPGEVEWIPTELHASDVVDTGNAVTSFMSADGLATLPDGLVRQATAGLDQLFEGCSRDVVEARCTAFLSRYLDRRYGGSSQMTTTETKPAETAAPVEQQPQVTQQAPATQQEAQPVVQQLEPVVSHSKDRGLEIAQLCQLAGCPEKTVEYLSNEKLSAADVRQLLAEKVTKEQELAPHKPQESVETQLSPEEQLKRTVRADYLKQKDMYDKLGVTEEELLAAAQHDASLYAS